MAQRRMFSLKIVSSDAFLEMPTSSRELYFQLGMYADDDGFVNPKKIMRMVGSQDDDLKILIAKRFVITFENGVVVIKHWKINNLIRKDFYQETLYLEQKKDITTKENGAYTELCKQIVNNLSPQVRIGKVRIGNNYVAGASPTTEEISFNWEDYRQVMLKDKRRHIRIIGLYLGRINKTFSSKGEVEVAIKRHSSAAVQAAKFTNEEISSAIEKCEQMKDRNGENIRWTLETCVKELTK